MKSTIDYLDELSEKVVNNLDNDLCGAYYIAFGELITAFVECGVFKSEQDLNTALNMKDRLSEILLKQESYDES